MGLIIVNGGWSSEIAIITLSSASLYLPWSSTALRDWDGTRCIVVILFLNKLNKSLKKNIKIKKAIKILIQPKKLHASVVFSFLFFISCVIRLLKFFHYFCFCHGLKTIIILGFSRIIFASLKFKNK